MLACGSDPEMPLIHQKIDAVFLRRDRERFLLGDFLIDLQIGNVELESAGRPRILAHCAGNGE